MKSLFRDIEASECFAISSVRDAPRRDDGSFPGVSPYSFFSPSCDQFLVS